MSRGEFLAAVGAGGTLCLLSGLRGRTAWAAPFADAAEPADSVVLRWNEAFLQGVRESRLGPPMISRALAVGHTCIYDAWAAYDNTAVGTRLGGSLRRPGRERTVANLNRAISFAAYRAAVDLFPGSASSAFDPLMQALGYDPTDGSSDTGTATGIGNVAARAVLDFRHRDGANQLGDEPGGIAGVPYSDYTGDTPVNDPMDIRVPFDPATVHDASLWQPLRYVDATGVVVTPASSARSGSVSRHLPLRPVAPLVDGAGEIRIRRLRRPGPGARRSQCRAYRRAEDDRRVLG